MDTSFFSGGHFLEYGLLLGGMILLAFGIPALIRRSMKVDKTEWNSSLYINSFHKKGDWAIRTGYIAALIIGFILTQSLLYIAGLLGALMLLQVGFQTYVERRYLENPANYRASLFQIGFISIAIMYVIVWLQVSPTFAS